MKLENAIKILDNIDGLAKDSTKNGEALIEQLKALRPFYIEAEYPTATKVIRLTYEHLEAEGSYKIEYPHTDELAELGGIDHLQYLLQMLRSPGNKYNLEDLKEIGVLLKTWGTPEYTLGQELDEPEEGDAGEAENAEVG